jgi:hypothetical protein
MPKKNNSRVKLALAGAVIAVGVAAVYMNNANAQQVKYTPTTAKDSTGTITECGFEFVASLPNGYGMQGVATFSPYSHLDFDVSAGKFRLGKLDKLDPQKVTLYVPTNAISPNAERGRHYL